jgi:AcrR family transcriptional regulator
MASSTKTSKAEEPVSIWMRPETPPRRTPGPQRTFSRAAIVAAAIRLADTEGLEAASMRRIAQEVGAGAMTLYHYVPSRDDLLELMVDEVAGELDLPGEPGPHWRAALTLLAERKRALWLRHPWLATRMPGHPIWGPNSLRMQEYSLSVLSGFDLEIDQVVSLLGSLNGYVESFVRSEVGWAEEARRTKLGQQEWMKMAAPLARRIVTEGKHPMFARMLLETVTPHLEPDESFRYGLERVLDSIAAALPAESRSSTPEPPSITATSA